MKRRALILLATLAAATCVQAQTPPTDAQREAAREAIAKSCSTDIKSYCADKQPGRDMMMCLRTNQDKLSGDCKDALATMRRNAPPPSQ
jgi:Cysteine rich repeat